jgi:hypothetical protein
MALARVWYGLLAVWYVSGRAPRGVPRHATPDLKATFSGGNLQWQPSGVATFSGNLQAWRPSVATFRRGDLPC